MSIATATATARREVVCSYAVLWYICCLSFCVNQKTINVSAVPTAPRVSFQPLNSPLAYPGFNEQYAQQYKNIFREMTKAKIRHRLQCISAKLHLHPLLYPLPPLRQQDQQLPFLLLLSLLKMKRMKTFMAIHYRLLISKYSSCLFCVCECLRVKI